LFGQDVAALGIDNDARAGGVDLLLELLRDVKIFPEQGGAIKRIVLTDLSVNGDVATAGVTSRSNGAISVAKGGAERAAI
jgi:hypothetical protein